MSRARTFRNGCVMLPLEIRKTISAWIGPFQISIAYGYQHTTDYSGRGVRVSGPQLFHDDEIEDNASHLLHYRLCLVRLGLVSSFAQPHFRKYTPKSIWGALKYRNCPWSRWDIIETRIPQWLHNKYLSLLREIGMEYSFTTNGWIWFNTKYNTRHIEPYIDYPAKRVNKTGYKEAKIYKIIYDYI